MLVWLNLEAFELIAHEVEYSNEITMSFIDLVLFSSLVRAQKRSNESNNEAEEEGTRGAGGADSQAATSLAMAALAAVIALVQLGVYNLGGVTSDGERLGEKNAHYCEFAFEVRPEIR